MLSAERGVACVNAVPVCLSRCRNLGGMCASVAAPCACDDGYTGTYCSIAPVDVCPSGSTWYFTAPTSITDRSVQCCSGVLVPVPVGQRGSSSLQQCCTSGVLDYSGRCCDSGVVDACGVCNGNGTFVDASGSCCHSGGVPDAGVQRRVRWLLPRNLCRFR